MVGYDCPECNGTGREEVITIRQGKVDSTFEACSSCQGAGSFTNGRPDIFLTVTKFEEWRETH